MGRRNLDEVKIAEFKAAYRDRNDDDLVDLWGRKEQLLDEARSALSEIIAERQIDIDEVFREEALERKRYEQKEAAKAEKQSRWQSLFLKVFLIVTVPIAIISFLANPQPGKLLLVAISSGVQGLVLALIVVGMNLLRKKLKK